MLLPLFLALAPGPAPTQAPSTAPPAKRIDLAALPRPGAWTNAPKDFKVLSGDSLSITASKQTDLFNEIGSGRHTATAPMLVFPADDTFVLTAAVRVDFEKEFDGGFLVVYSDPDHWMKLLFEQGHYGPYSVGSTVTDVYSDGSANADVAGNEVFLRLTRAKDVFGFYYSLDGKKWIYIRYFRFSASGPLKVGFGSQSPLGEQCTTVFSRIRYAPRPTRDYWTGEPEEAGTTGT
jgi:regulation of enolase protein 1 (concanavalin A-like superfamily)